MLVYDRFMKKYLREIYQAFDGKLHGSGAMKWAVCRTLAVMPEEVINHITADCWFLASTPDAFAFAFSGDDVAGKHLIVLSDDLFAQSNEQIVYTIAHEIGHVILGHRNAIMAAQSKREIAQQEQEAHEFALRYL